MKSPYLPLTKRKEQTRQTVLAALPGTYKEIMAKTGLSDSAVMFWIRHLHARQLIHVSAWAGSRVQSKPMKVMSLGAGPDARVQDAVMHPEKGMRFDRVQPMRVHESTVAHAMRVQPALAGVWA